MLGGLSLFFLVVTVAVSAAVRLGAALLSVRIQHSVSQHPIAHIIWFTAGLAAFVLVLDPFLHGGVRNRHSETHLIISNLRQLDGAMQQWALDHGRTGAVMATKEDIAPYLRYSFAPDGLVKSVAGERYILKTITEPPEAHLTCELDGRPKGTVFRLGTTSVVEIILPKGQ
jgi:hypothetical protein